MMYSEFAEATGCRDNAHNHEVFRGLEILYMECDLSKEDIYKMAKPLLDNRKNPEQLKLEAEINAEISLCEENIDYWKREYERYKVYASDESNKEWKAYYKETMKRQKREIEENRARIKALRWVLE